MNAAVNQESLNDDKATDTENGGESNNASWLHRYTSIHRHGSIQRNSEDNWKSIQLNERVRTANLFS